MPWTFEIAGGSILNPDGSFAASAYSGGDKGQRPDGVDNVSDEATKNVGPLPEGIYTLGTPVDHSQLGPFAIPLIPDPSNQMYGRGSMYIHGDTAAMNHSASEGCIITNRNTRNAMWVSSDHELRVVAA